jgi:hypothetical protein
VEEAEVQLHGFLASAPDWIERYDVAGRCAPACGRVSGRLGAIVDPLRVPAFMTSQARSILAERGDRVIGRQEDLAPTPDAVAGSPTE